MSERQRVGSRFTIDNGHRSSIPFGYDNLNHLIWAKDSATDGGAATSLATYVYDVFGDRIEKDLWSSGTTTILRFAYSSPLAGDGLGSAGNLWADLNGSGSLLERYILGDSVDQLFARIFSTGTAGWYLTDRLGSVRDITDNTGVVIDHLNYDGFGNVTSETQPWNGDRFKWTGRELDSETGLQYGFHTGGLVERFPPACTGVLARQPGSYPMA